MYNLHKYLFLIFLLSFGIEASAQNKIKWISWEDAMEKSKTEKRKIFIDVYTDWCGWCKKMDMSTFSEDHIARYINKYYYAIKFNAEKKEDIILNGTTFKYVRNGQRGYHELAVHLLQGKMSYPSTVFLDEQFNIIQAIPGYQDISNFEMIISYFGTDNHKSVPWNRFMAGFHKNSYFNNLVTDRN
jgi:thioredoxin-related protein